MGGRSGNRATRHLRQHMLTAGHWSAYADGHGNNTGAGRERHQQRPRRRAARGGGAKAPHRADGDPPGRQRPSPRLVVAGDRRPARRDQADRASQARPAGRETVMLERFTGDARGVVTGARESALRLGHDWIGCEHLLLALATTGGEVGVILRDRGITPERVTWEAVRLAGAGRGASLSDVLDRDALASIGIDLDAVRDKVEAAFGPGTFTAAPGRGP